MHTTSRTLSLLLASVLATSALAADFTVDSMLDAVDAAPGNGACATGAGACTLRAAVQEANALGGADRVLLPAGTFVLTIAGQDEDAAATGDLDVTAPLTIEGAGPGATIVDANGIDRVFDVGVTTTLRGLTVTGGDPGGLSGGGVFSAPFGGDYTLTVERVHFTGNTAFHGGGIMNEQGSTLVLRQSSFVGNTATFGTAVENQDVASLENVTVSGNASGGGGALRNDGAFTLSHVTVVNDTIVSSGGLSIGASVLDAGAAGAVCSASTSPTSDGRNVEHGTSCGLAGTGDQSGVDPLLGPLGDAGDGTWSHALLTGSPAIDVVSACPPPSVDQRGVTRPIDGDLVAGAACDAGAFEAPVVGATTTTTTVPTTTTTSTSSTTITTITTTTSSTTSSTIIGTTSTTSTSSTSISTTSTIVGSTSTSSTTTTVSSTSSTTVGPSSTTTTTTIGGSTSTTTTTLPPALLLDGKKLLLGDSPVKPAKRKLSLLSKDVDISLGDGNGSAADPVLEGGSLRVVATGGDGFDATYSLDQAGWAYLKGEGANKGYKFRKGTPVRKILLKPGKSLKITAKGDALMHTLVSQPDAVRVELRLGAQRYCFAFGGEQAFKPEKRLRAKDAAAPTDCP